MIPTPRTTTIRRIGHLLVAATAVLAVLGGSAAAAPGSADAGGGAVADPVGVDRLEAGASGPVTGIDGTARTYAEPGAVEATAASDESGGFRSVWKRYQRVFS